MLCPIIFFYNQIKMKKVLFVFSIMLLPITAMALDCKQYTSATTCPAGCTYSEPTGCTTCSAGKYGLGGENACQQCPESHPKSEEGSTSQNSCYTTCENKPDFKNGTWTPDNTKPNYPNACSWTNTNNITCNDESNCNGFHKSGNECVSNKQPCNKYHGTGYNIWNGSKFSTTCYLTQCDEDYHGENVNTINPNTCNENYYKDCASNRGECKDKFSCAGGTVTGSYSWVNDYRFDDCKCTINHSIPDDGHGKEDKTCPLKSGSKPNKYEWDTENCTTTVTSCDIGYCLKPNDTNANSCDPAPRGYYHSSSDTKDCQSCPAGSTSNGTTTTDDKTTLASSKSDCHIVRGTSGTVFCDGDGCFTLPGSGNIPWTGK